MVAGGGGEAGNSCLRGTASVWEDEGVLWVDVVMGSQHWDALHAMVWTPNVLMVAKMCVTCVLPQ